VGLSAAVRQRGLSRAHRDVRGGRKGHRRRRDRTLVGAIVLDTAHPSYLPRGLVPPGALYVRTLISDRTPAGSGAGGLLLDFAKSRAADLGLPLALDHWSGSPELAGLQERAGFTEIGAVTLDRAVPWQGTPSASSALRGGQRTPG
jgi:hypothetical protein